MPPAQTPQSNPADHAPLIHFGEPEFRRMALALFAAGFATFALLYCVQPLMPVFAREFHVSAAESSLPMSLTTGVLAPAMIVAGTISEARGRVPLMLTSLLGSSVLTFACAFAPRWGALLTLRALAGLTFAGLPAVSMAYLSEEMNPNSVGLAMGLAISGNGLGGMVGRLLASLVAGWLSWRWSMAIVGFIGIASTIIAWRSLPPSRHFRPHVLRLGALTQTFRAQMYEPKLVPLYIQGFVLMGAFVTTYNYVTYHLLAAPYLLSHTAVGFIFLVYIVGIFSSSWIGSLADRIGRTTMLATMAAMMLTGILLMAARPLAIVILGVAIVTFGFFGGHSIASSWVGLRASHAKAQAAALYLFFYYMGSSVVGSSGGLFWDRWGWIGVVGFVATLCTVSLVVALGLRRTTPAVAPAAS